MHGSSNDSPAPRGRDRFVTFSQTASRPALLYQGDGATVTTAIFQADGNQYPVAELDHVERVEHGGGLLQSRQFELWALFRGQRVRLFQCLDAREFGQVCRALTRAREYAGLA